MALYLGNQKISLRSGQDPTFDYGFDSNGRLVFANKNATEINNFLNYDSSYSEILDLSNLSKMEKVAVNGTADRKMEGLKGLLVSPNAPFTGSSPQINASYTGLNKSALVSLFESMPYNVGYEKVGNPTIVDGVVSGFSGNDYLNLSQRANNSIPFEMVVCFTANSVTPTSGDGLGICMVGDAQMFITRNSKLSVKYSTGSNNWISEPTILSANTKYWGKFTYDGTNVGISISTNGTNFTTPTTQANNPRDREVGPKFGYLYSAYQVFDGSIDLNETYIKVNGVPWFTGKPAMTKTCSIVGCTGTADLTQEDKNIILNKGWSLTVQ